MREVRERVAQLPHLGRLSGCFWGEQHGARLSAGLSVPEYDRSRGGRRDADEETIARWAVLYTDPWYELRLLRSAWKAAGELPPDVDPPAELLRVQLDGFVASPDLRARLARAELDASFDAALAALRAAPEFDEAVRTADDDMSEHRQAIARALIAFTLADAQARFEQAGPTVDGHTRDELVELLTDELYGYTRGIGDWLARPFKGVAAWATTRLVERRRGAISDLAAPAAGDILLYQARGGDIRAAIRQAVADTRAARVTILAHSLGGIAAVDLLVAEPIAEVDRLVTVGSQASFLYEIGALVSLRAPDPLPDHFPAWLNIYDPRDFLSYVGAGVFPGRVEDQEVDNVQPFPQSHSAYWSNRYVWEAVGAFVR
ncbi:hypothetical protein GCM10010532_096260 [Dactylosporangium siamense]|uniref:Alpha/beta hydrolase n=1 Tax=Dactylosporangium siamense TaxID=685454 RepID=A0A919PS74_9ACTN|nr:hypothetical protein Dsi01nite_079610 [Dactylosporangium siamense]